MKKIIVKDKIWLVNVSVALAMLIGVAIIVGLMLEAHRIREFKVDVFVLSYESRVCEADGPDGKVIMNEKNLPAIYALVQKAKGRMDRGDNTPIDNVTFYFECHDEAWTMSVDKLNSDRLRIELTGPRKYTMYLGDKESFEEFQKAASSEGYVTGNKVLRTRH